MDHQGAYGNFARGGPGASFFKGELYESSIAFHRNPEDNMRTAVTKDRPKEVSIRKIGKEWRAAKKEAREQIFAREADFLAAA
jgi:hypothetical protein